jgi:hypothetical protein
MKETICFSRGLTKEQEYGIKDSHRPGHKLVTGEVSVNDVSDIVYVKNFVNLMVIMQYCRSLSVVYVFSADCHLFISCCHRMELECSESCGSAACLRNRQNGVN